MEIDTRKEKGVVVVSVKGRMDAITSLEFDQSMSNLVSAGENMFLINLSQLEFISSSGLRSVLKLAKELKANNGKILFAALRDPVFNVFKISGFNTIFKIYDTEEDALRA
jgi:anti-sigma B factor antagonist/stage II sporulation protein AA (anti-sigma F factor antagonist)